MKRISVLIFLSIVAGIFLFGCGPVAMPKGAYSQASDLLADMAKRRKGAKSFRIAGRVDHFGEEHRVQGKLFIFAKLPGHFRVDLLSPFGSTMSALAVKDGHFTMADQREGTYLEGPAEPCNIARLIRIPLPVDDVIRILVGDTPVIEGESEIAWDKEGFYRVKITDGTRIQTMEIDPDRDALSLRRSKLRDAAGVVYDVRYDRWRLVDGVHVPYEIRVKMPRDKADLEVLYDDDGVEVNVKLPKDAWEISFPDGAQVDQVTCD